MIETIQYKSIRWLDITNPSEDDYRLLLEDYHFHPLDIEDCRGTNQRPKIDEYDDYYFLILHFPYFDKGNKFIRIREVKIFWGRDFIITVGKAHWVVKKFFDEIQEDLQEGDEETQEMLATSDQLLYHILNRLMLETNTLVQRVGAEVDLINYDIFNKRARSIIEQISVTRRNTILLNTTFKPQLRVLHMFESGGIKGFVDPDVLDMEDYWGNILDQYQKMFDSIEDFGELIEGLSQTDQPHQRYHAGADLFFDHHASVDGGGQFVRYECGLSLRHQHHSLLGHHRSDGADDCGPYVLLPQDDGEIVVFVNSEW